MLARAVADSASSSSSERTPGASACLCVCLCFCLGLGVGLGFALVALGLALGVVGGGVNRRRDDADDEAVYPGLHDLPGGSERPRQEFVDAVRVVHGGSVVSERPIGRLPRLRSWQFRRPARLAVLRGLPRGPSRQRIPDLVHQLHRGAR